VSVAKAIKRKQEINETTSILESSPKKVRDQTESRVWKAINNDHCSIEPEVKVINECNDIFK
jgi:hypothetical protein